MQPASIKRNAGQIYLSLVPFSVTAFAFVTGHVSYKVYLPIWILNVCLMAIAAWVLGAHLIRNNNVEKKQLAVAALFLIIPWMFISIFAGMGPPPDTAKEWVATAAEQQVRYCILITSGILIAFSLTVLREKLKAVGENFYSQLGFAAIMIAIPLFLLVTSFWDCFALETYKLQIASASDKLPEWYMPVKKQIDVITMVEVVLTYFATAAFAAALKAAGWFSKNASRIYITISLLTILLIVLSPFYPASVTSANFPFIPLMIPAIAFLMLYFIGINLLRRAGN